MNMTSNTQELVCVQNPIKGAYWSPNPIPCIPVSCKYPPPALPANARLEIVYSPNNKTNMQYQTEIVYYCPGNGSLHPILRSNFSFDYSLSFGNVYNVTVSCEDDGYLFDKKTSLRFLTFSIFETSQKLYLLYYSRNTPFLYVKLSSR